MQGDLFHYQNERRATIFVRYMVSVYLWHVIDCFINTQKREDCALSPRSLPCIKPGSLDHSSISVYAECVVEVSVI